MPLFGGVVWRALLGDLHCSSSLPVGGTCCYTEMISGLQSGAGTAGFNFGAYWHSWKWWALRSPGRNSVAVLSWIGSDIGWTWSAFGSASLNADACGLWSTSSGTVPALVRTVMRFLAKKLSFGLRTTPAAKPEKMLPPYFRTDAKCEEDKVVLGGWRLGPDTKLAPWFQVTLTPDIAPWLFRDGQGSSWASSSAELLASLIAVLCFDPPDVGDLRLRHEVALCGGTDNKANEGSTRRGLSTKMPLMLVLMEYMHQCDLRETRVYLKWRPLEENQHADDITNNVLNAFGVDNRVQPVWASILKSMTFLPDLLSFLRDFEDAKAADALDKVAGSVGGKKRKFETKTVWG